MRTKGSTLCVLITCAILAAQAAATQSSRANTQSSTVAPPAVPVAEAFSISTSSEKWALDDPVPIDTVQFGGKKITYQERQVTATVAPGGERQLVFPVSWYGPYQGIQGDLKFIVVRYDNKRARTIMAEYERDRLSMPKSDFKYDASGKRYYRDISFVRQGGMMYIKQALSSGTEDGKGNYWVDAIVMYSVDDPTPAAATTTTKKKP